MMHFKRIKKALLGLMFITVPGLMAEAIILPTLNLNGDAYNSGIIHLTGSQDYKKGSAYINTPFTTTANTTFSTFFELKIDGGNGINGADGMAFVIQNDPAGADAISTVSGSSLGYGGTANSLAVEFDTWRNQSHSDPDNNHVGIDLNGNMQSVNTAHVNFDMNDGNIFYVWIDYNGNIMKVFIANTNSKPSVPIMSYPFNISSLGNNVFFGFTGATGDRNNDHQILSWDLTVQNSVVGVPMSDGVKLILMFLFGAGGLFFVARQRRLV